MSHLPSTSSGTYSPAGNIIQKNQQQLFTVNLKRNTVQTKNQIRGMGNNPANRYIPANAIDKGFNNGMKMNSNTQNYMRTKVQTRAEPFMNEKEDCGPNPYQNENQENYQINDTNNYLTSLNVNDQKRASSLQKYNQLRMSIADASNFEASDLNKPNLNIFQKLRNPQVKMTEATDGDKDLAKTIIEEDLEKVKKDGPVKLSKFNAGSSFFALFVIMMIRVTANWQQKSIGYFYGFKGSGLQANNPAFELATFYPELESYYGLLCGLCYTLPYALSGLYMGALSKQGNRKWMLIGVVSLISLFQIGAGTIPSFALLCAFRFLHGTISSSVDPLAYSMVSDMFPPEKRTTANSILSAGNFLGIAVSSMTILLIKQIGWKMAYNVMGIAGIGCAGLLLLLKEPIRGQFDKMKLICATDGGDDELSYVQKPVKKKPEGLKDFWKQLQKLFQNPVCNNLFKAYFLRGMGSSMITAYAPVFFVRCWPEMKTTYALLNAIALTCLGFSSSLLGGMICDKYEKKFPMIKSKILIYGNTIAIPLIAFACWTSNFYLAMAAFAATIFATGSYFAPGVTMMQNSVPAEDSGIVVSTLSLFTYSATTISPLIFSRIAKYYNAAAHPKVYGLVILLATTLGYLSSNIFYYKGGKQYVKKMEEKRLKEQYDECVVAQLQ